MDSTSITLLDALRADDAQAWRVFDQVYRPVILLWILPRLADSNQAQDVAQEVVLAVHQQIGKFQREQGAAKFRGWLKTITHYKTVDHLRKNRGWSDAISSQPPWETLPPGRRESPETSAEPAGDAELAGDSSPAALKRELTLLVQQVALQMKCRFRETTWQSFWRTTVDEVDAKTVAAELSIGHDAVRKNKSRVAKSLKKELERLGVHDFLGLKVSQHRD